MFFFMSQFKLKIRYKIYLAYYVFPLFFSLLDASFYVGYSNITVIITYLGEREREKELERNKITCRYLF